MPRPCESVHPDPVPLVCGLCWKFVCNRAYREKWGGDPDTARDDLPFPATQDARRPATNLLARSPHRNRPCAHEGEVRSWCPAGDEARHRRVCLHDDGPDLCSRAGECQTCPHYSAAGTTSGVSGASNRPDATTTPSTVTSHLPASSIGPKQVQALAGQSQLKSSTVRPSTRIVARFDETNLWPGVVPGLRFNPSLLAHGDGYLFAARNGWAGSEVWVGRLDRDLRPVGPPRALKLWHEMASHGREDPRLFYHEGRPHIAYVGVTWPIRTHVLYARLTADGMATEAVWYPEYKRRRYWEKSWSCISHGGQIYAVYGIAPRHRIVRLDGDRATTVYETPTPHPWAGGEPRGGASPVLIGDEWYSFFHSQSRHNGAVAYEMGVYTFEDKPPFRVRRFTASAIDVASWKTKPRRPRGNGPNRPVIFPCGAVLDGDRWLVSMGVHDGWAEIREYSAADIEARLA